MWPKKSVVIGDHGIGKTSMIITYASNTFPDVIPNVFWEYDKYITYNEKTINLVMWDTCALEEYDRLRPLSYPNTDVFLICFSVINKTSFKNVKEKWYPEVSHKHSKIPILLVGTKTDLRNEENYASNNSQYVTYLEGVEMANQIGAVNYYECSALKQIGLKELFDEVAKLILYPPKVKNKSRCTLL